MQIGKRLHEQYKIQKSGVKKYHRENKTKLKIKKQYGAIWPCEWYKVEKSAVEKYRHVGSPKLRRQQ